MLKFLQIRDFTIISETEMELQSGMTALTGETGAGKSILLDAIALVLGGRMDVGSIREGARRAEVAAEFAPEKSSPVWPWLEAHDLDDDTQCLLRRVVSIEGKSRGYVNGRAVSMQLLRELGDMLVDIHGQHEHLALTRPETQRALLDSLPGNTNLTTQVAQSYERWLALNEALASYAERHQRRSERIDTLRYQLQEFDELAVGQHDPQALEQEFNRADNAGKLLELCEAVLNALEHDSQGAESSLAQALRHAQHLESLDSNIGEVTEMLNTAVIVTNEAASAVRTYSDRLELDPARLQWLDAQLSGLYRLAQKHHVGIDDLAATESRLRTELDELNSDDLSLEEMTRERDALWEVYVKQSRKLSRLRNKHAATFSTDVTAAMQSLGMPDGVFECTVETDPELASAHGMDRIRFLTSPNPGSRPADIKRVASGGELSRISLAVALVSRSDQQLPTLIFDEVDSGIGGAVAETVGRYLRTLGKHAQVLCVTHLPQVAAQAHHHLQVVKHTHSGQTLTELHPLDQKATVEEIARMLGGSKITRKSRQHAQEMLDSVD